MNVFSIPLLLAMTTGQSPSQDPERVSLDTTTVRPRLIELMREGIETEDPNFSLYPWGEEAERGGLFTGSYDWHSCVIAHWCLLVHARTAGDDELEAWLIPRLDEEELANEVELIKRRAPAKQRTSPYDEAWLLMLLAELEKHPSCPTGVSGWRGELESQLLGWLEESPFPERGERGFSGAYSSWLMTLLLVTWSEPVSEGARERLRALSEDKLTPHRRDLAALTRAHGYDFLWLPALLALVDRSRSEGAAAFNPGAPQPLPDAVTVPTVHPLGVAISRTWPDAFDAGLGSAPAEARYRAHLAHFLAREDLWAGEFDACSHWLPQFLWIGIWLAEGRP